MYCMPKRIKGINTCICNFFCTDIPTTLYYLVPRLAIPSFTSLFNGERKLEYTDCDREQNTEV
jgi:hypothetical protein